MVRTQRGAVRRYNAILAQCRRDFRGGLKYGMDWSTLAICFPDRYAEIKHLRAIYKELKHNACFNEVMR